MNMELTLNSNCFEMVNWMMLLFSKPKTKMCMKLKVVLDPATLEDKSIVPWFRSKKYSKGSTAKEVSASTAKDMLTDPDFPVDGVAIILESETYRIDCVLVIPNLTDSFGPANSPSPKLWPVIVIIVPGLLCVNDLLGNERNRIGSSYTTLLTCRADANVAIDIEKKLGAINPFKLLHDVELSDNQVDAEHAVPPILDVTVPPLKPIDVPEIINTSDPVVASNVLSMKFMDMNAKISGFINENAIDDEHKAKDKSKNLIFESTDPDFTDIDESDDHLLWAPEEPWIFVFRDEQ